MTHVIDLPRHYYGFVDRDVLSAGQRDGWERAVLFGLTSTPAQALGLTVLLECGAVYRQLPPSAWSFVVPGASSGPWTVAGAQAWDCLGWDAVAVEYRYLRSLAVQTRAGHLGTYRFSVEWYGDGFSEEPSQSKTLHAIELNSGRLTFQPGDKLLWQEASFTTHQGKWPTWLRRSETVHMVERWSGNRLNSEEFGVK